MRTADCNHCDKKALPLNETIKVDSAVYCAECFEKNFTEQSQLEGHTIEKEFDPTVCTTCGNDFGETELGRIAGHPTCESCEETIRKRSFPTWVKAFFVGVLVLVIFSIVWNMRFYIAHIHLKKMTMALQTGNMQQASQSAEIASKNVPEMQELQFMSQMYKGIFLILDEQSDKGMETLISCKAIAPAEYHGALDNMILQASIGSAFEAKNYELFLEKCKRLLDNNPEDPSSLAYVASAYACLYAQNGLDSLKRLSIEYLDKSKAYPDSTGEMNKYYNRIEYRLYSREVIGGKEFEKKFPNGWIKPQS